MDGTGTNGDGGSGTRSGRMRRLAAMPVLFRVAAVLVSIAAVVFVVDTLRDDGGAANEATTAAAVAGDSGSAQTAPSAADGDSEDGGPL